MGQTNGVPWRFSPSEFPSNEPDNKAFHSSGPRWLALPGTNSSFKPTLPPNERGRSCSEVRSILDQLVKRTGRFIAALVIGIANYCFAAATFGLEGEAIAGLPIAAPLWTMLLILLAKIIGSVFWIERIWIWWNESRLFPNLFVYLGPLLFVMSRVLGFVTLLVPSDWNASIETIQATACLLAFFLPVFAMANWPDVDSLIDRERQTEIDSDQPDEGELDDDPVMNRQR